MAEKTKPQKKSTRPARSIVLSRPNIVDQWNALFDAHPWLEGLSTENCESVFCCPGPEVEDWAALSEASSLLFLSGFNGQPTTLCHSLIPSN